MTGMMHICAGLGGANPRNVENPVVLALFWTTGAIREEPIRAHQPIRAEQSRAEPSRAKRSREPAITHQLFVAVLAV